MKQYYNEKRRNFVNILVVKKVNIEKLFLKEFQKYFLTY